MPGRGLAGILAAAAIFAGVASHPARSAPAADWFACIDGQARAVEACTRILNTPGEPAESRDYALVYRGAAHLEAKALDAAAADFNAALQSPAPLAHAAYELGLVAKARGDWPGAIAAFTKAAGSAAEDSDTDHFTHESVGNFRQLPLAELGYALYRNGQAEAALEPLRRAAAACPSCAIAPRYQSYALASRPRRSRRPTGRWRWIPARPEASSPAAWRGPSAATRRARFATTTRR